MMLKKLILLLSFLIITDFAIALAPPGPPGGGSQPCGWPNPNTCIPIDGGIGLLLAAAAAFGAKKIYYTRNKN
jgi:hypothetical protein